MSQSAVVRDYRVLKVGRRRANRLVLTVAGCRGAMGIAAGVGARRPAVLPPRSFRTHTRRSTPLADPRDRVGAQWELPGGCGAQKPACCRGAMEIAGGLWGLA